MTQQQKNSPDTVAKAPPATDKAKLASDTGAKKDEKSGSCSSKGGCGCG